MKCPKCGYIGFEQAERCRNCGYDFSLATQAAPEEFPLRRDVAGPLEDFDLGDAGPPATATPPAARSRRKHDPAFDPGITPPAGSLPLFGGGALDDFPIVPTASPTPPLAVRRAPSPLSKPRPRPTPRLPEPDPQPALTFTTSEPYGDAGRSRDDAEPADATAPLAPRAAAGLLDLGLLVALDLVVLYFTLRICQLSTDEASQLPVVPLAAFLLLLNGGYLALFTGVGGQTIGQMAAGVRVVSEGEAVLSPGQAAWRTLLFLASLVPAGIGLLSIFVDRGRRGLHDRLSGTCVVRAAAS